MRNSQQPFHQRLGQYSRRRRLMLVGCDQAAEPSVYDEHLNEQILLDPEILQIVRTLAEYLDRKSTDVDAMMGAASNLIRGKTTGSAVLADFPEVECEILPYEKQSQRQSLPTDPTSVFTDFGTPAGAETSEVAANSPETEQTTPPASRNTRATFARGDTFERKPISGTSGINRIRGWLHDHQPRVWMFVGDETTAWMRYHGTPGYAEMFRHRLRWELRRFPDLIVNAGIQGAGIEEIEKITRQGLLQCRADVVFVMPGPQDLDLVRRQPHRYADRLADLAALIREQGAEPVFQTPPLPRGHANAVAPPALSQLADIIRDVCVVHQIPLMDHAEFWMEQPPCEEWYDLHSETLTEAGQSALALLFFSELDLYDRSSPLCARLQLAWQNGREGEQILPATAAVREAAANESPVQPH